MIAYSGRITKRGDSTVRPSNLQGMCHDCHSRKTAIEDGRWGEPGGDQTNFAEKSGPVGSQCFYDRRIREYYFSILVDS